MRFCAFLEVLGECGRSQERMIKCHGIFIDRFSGRETRFVAALRIRITFSNS
jgi:hypothetical protein